MNASPAIPAVPTPLPPAGRQALALVQALLGCPGEAVALADAPWRTSIAGAQRVICLHAAQPDGQLTI